MKHIRGLEVALDREDAGSGCCINGTQTGLDHDNVSGVNFRSAPRLNLLTSSRLAIRSEGVLTA